MKQREFSTPMMQQYVDIKNQYSDCLLFYRLGDFYELFLEDAEIGAQVLGIALTARPRGKDGDVPMAGVPYHAAESYLAKLVNAGYKVAICEQVSEPTKGAAIVERAVVRVVTPGTIVVDSALDKKQHNFLMSFAVKKSKVGVAVLDLSTGMFSGCEFLSKDTARVIASELQRYCPRECLIADSVYNQPTLLKTFSNQSHMVVFPYQQWVNDYREASELLQEHFSVQSLVGFGLQTKKEVQCAAASLLRYVQETQQSQVQHIVSFTLYHPEDAMLLDFATQKNLVLFETLHTRDSKGSLIHLLDKTYTPMGARKLRSWLAAPLKQKAKITARLDAVEALLFNQSFSKKIAKELSHVKDVERTLSKVSLGMVSPPDLIQLKDSLRKMFAIKRILQDMETSSVLLRDQSSSIDVILEKLIVVLEKTLMKEPKRDPKSGGVIAAGVDDRLDELRSGLTTGQNWLDSYQDSLREQTGIASLKVKYNKVFGFYIEVSKVHTSKVPDTFERTQTLVNSERYATQTLKKYETETLSAEEESHEIEYRLFQKLCREIADHSSAIIVSAQAIAVIDCLLSFAQLAKDSNYVKPTIHTGDTLVVKDGRHPVVEALLPVGSFVPNDIEMNRKKKQLLVLTGPNMAGKSVYMRQVALLVLMSHLGSFVPARLAEICLTDKIFVRSGASDNITSGLSTFMVEMVEAANILRHATEKSLVMMDEIGRGTSTYDGISLAWAIAEYLVDPDQSKPKTLFATHYHELQDLAIVYPDSICNLQMSVSEESDQPVFLHTVEAGAASHSYGIFVAASAGVPEEVIIRAKAKLRSMEAGKE